MAPSRRSSNGRSPLVNQQSQITSFFSKRPTSSSPSPSLPKVNPSPTPTSSTSPATPSPFQPKCHKTPLVIGPSSFFSPADTSMNSSGPNVVGKRIRVYWPLDRAWYEGRVNSFDKLSSKHLVRYDDGEEELLNLSVEKVEWPVDEPTKKFPRLRRFSLVDDEEANTTLEAGLQDESAGEECAKNTAKEEAEDDSDHLDFKVEEEANADALVNVKSKKRKLGCHHKTCSDSIKTSKNTAEIFSPHSTKERKSTTAPFSGPELVVFS